MTYKHGVSTSEIPTFIVPPATTTAGLPVVFGTAPVNLVSGEVFVNKPILAYSYSEAVQKLGYSDDFESYTLCEFMSSHFALFKTGPVVLINVLDPTIHKKPGTETLTITKGETVLKVPGILIPSLVVKSSDGTTTYTEDDYDVEFDNEGNLHIFSTVATEIKVEFNQLDPKAVQPSDIIGGVSQDGAYKGLELINHVFPMFRLVPGLIVAPKFSTNTSVAAVMAAKSVNINGVFKALALVDIPTDIVRDYTKVAAYKNDNNLTSSFQVVCWPKVSIDGKQYHMSTQAAGVMNVTDASVGGIPYKSPSNKDLKADSAVLSDGTEITLGQDQAAYLNGQGIVTALNFIGGWKLWGNRTGIYPGVHPGETDPKDSFIAVRRMFNNEQNDLILTYWEKVDDPMNKKLIETVIDSKNIDLNGKKARGYILGGRVEFLESENPFPALIDGKITFHMYLTPPIPAREIEFLVEFDVSYFKTLFG